MSEVIYKEETNYIFGAVIGAVSALVHSDDLNFGTTVGIAVSAALGGVATKTCGDFVGGILAYQIGKRTSGMIASNVNGCLNNQPEVTEEVIIAEADVSVL